MNTILKEKYGHQSIPKDVTVDHTESNKDQTEASNLIYSDLENGNSTSDEDEDNNISVNQSSQSRRSRGGGRGTRGGSRGAGRGRGKRTRVRVSAQTRRVSNVTYLIIFKYRPLEFSFKCKSSSNSKCTHLTIYTAPSEAVKRF